MQAMVSLIGGAVSDTGVSEEEINLKIVCKLQELFEASGTQVILTRSDENGIYDLDSESLKNKKTSDLKNRVKLANSEEADIFISIHLNKLENDSSVHGWQTFYQENNEDSKSLAGFIQENLNYSIQKENKRSIMKLTGKYIMDNVEIPTVTVECGFLSNNEEVENLQDDEYQNKLAWGIYCGTMDYFEK
jgi:N-acetylmuramoyl-L-alanine amidase